MSVDGTAAGRAWPSYWLSSLRRRLALRPAAVVLAVAACAALALLAQPLLSATTSGAAVRFITDAADLQQRAAGLEQPATADPAVRQWLDDARALLAAAPYEDTLHEATPAVAFERLETARALLASATRAAGEALHLQQERDRAVRIALLIAAVGGAWVGLRLRRDDTAPASPEAAAGLLAAPPPEPWLALIARIQVELAGPAPGRQTLTRLAQLLRETCCAEACGICLSDELGDTLQLPPVVHAGELGWPQLEQLHAMRVTGHLRFALEAGGAAQHGPHWEGIAVPVDDGRCGYGHLFIVGRQGATSLHTHLQLIDLVARLLATAFAHGQRDQENRRLALLEERTSMARELHDSLAQSLSFMKIQVSRMQTLLQRGARRDEVAAAAEEVRDGLNGAYRKLRELLTTFRTRIDAGGLAAALEDALEEYGARSSVAMALDNRLGNYPFSANEEFHIVQIVREALSNVVRHAGATQAVVTLALADDGLTVVTIEDDGEGFDPVPDHRNHHGTTIMRERALSLGGALSIERRAEGGSRVSVRFRPSAPDT
ncbi:MAG TPA: histidine kinase [Rhodocyclaceae bacterium]|nr:histidine kinase [Rhodocyclaceae bacterium]